MASRSLARSRSGWFLGIGAGSGRFACPRKFCPRSLPASLKNLPASGGNTSKTNAICLGKAVATLSLAGVPEERRGTGSTSSHRPEGRSRHMRLAGLLLARGAVDRAPATTGRARPRSITPIVRARLAVTPIVRARSRRSSAPEGESVRRQKQEGDMSASLTAIARMAKDPTLLPGVYNYCDQWCAYCAVKSRCLVCRVRGEWEAASGGLSTDTVDGSAQFTREIRQVDGQGSRSSTRSCPGSGSEPRRARGSPIASSDWRGAMRWRLRCS